VKVVLESAEIGLWPRVKLSRAPGEKEALNELFVFLSDRRVLIRGYGVRAGITDLDDLRQRVDKIRDRLDAAMIAVGPKAPIQDWLERLRKACSDLIDAASIALWKPGPETPHDSDFASAVDDMRHAFAYVADHVAAVHRLPAARRLEEQIRGEIGSSGDGGR
jgi:hypothetical protein